MSIFSDIGHVLTLKAVRDRLKESAKGRALLTTLFALTGGIVTAIVAQWTAACPGLASSLGAIGTAAAGGAVAYLARKPLQAAGVKAAAVGVLGGAIAGAVQSLQAICGADFVHQLGPLATAGLWVALGAYLHAPHEVPALPPAK